MGVKFIYSGDSVAFVHRIIVIKDKKSTSYITDIVSSIFVTKLHGKSCGMTLKQTISFCKRC